MKEEPIAQTLPASYYTEPGILAQELEQIFYRSWMYGCHQSELPKPGSFKTIQVGKEQLFLIRGKDNQVRAFYNVCPHRAHRLVQGAGEKQVIVCPYHAWSFYSDGRICNARGCKDIPGFEQSNYHLKGVRTENFLGFIFVCLNAQTPSLQSTSGNLEEEIRQFVPQIDQLQFAHRIAYDIKANWKVVVDNYLECYHCPPTHPDFVDLVDLKSYRSKTYGIYSSHIGKMACSTNSAYSVTSSDQITFGGWWLWPNLTFTVFPGRSNISIMNMIPTSPDQTVEYFDFFFLDKQPDAQEQAVIDYIRDKLQPEDVALVESVQQGLHSRAYDRGPLVIDPGRTEMSEHALWHFHQLVANSMPYFESASPPLSSPAFASSDL